MRALCRVMWALCRVMRGALPTIARHRASARISAGASARAWFETREIELAVEGMVRRSLHRDAGETGMDRDLERSAGQVHAHGRRLVGAPGDNRRDRGGACTGATRQGDPAAALPDHEVDLA